MKNDAKIKAKFETIWRKTYGTTNIYDILSKIRGEDGVTKK
jgi:hypothetical protein